jgi:hypothetical protein
LSVHINNLFTVIVGKRNLTQRREGRKLILRVFFGCDCKWDSCIAD